jgi:hypothetical protein
MGLLSRPWFRLSAVGVLTVVGIVVAGIAGASAFPRLPLPYTDTLRSERHVLATWDGEASRARYVDEGYELLVKLAGRKAFALPNTWSEWDLRIRVTVDFRGLRGDWRDDDPAPTAGVMCEDETPASGVRTLAAKSFYDFRVGPDGRYAIYRWTGDDARLLASNVTAGLPRIAVSGPLRLEVVCQRRSPTTLRLSVNDREILSARDADARFWGRAGLIVGAGNERDVSVVFRDLAISGR